MSQVTLRFYAGLNFFLPIQRRQHEFAYGFDGRQSIKDMIEALGIPHTEVDLVIVNGESVDFTYIVQQDDYISVYPQFESPDIAPLIHLRPEPLAEPCFVCDIHLGRLASHLRMLGFDTLFPEDYRDEELARISAEEDRILLTRDRGLLKRSVVIHGCYVRSTNPRQQVIEVVQRYNLSSGARPFYRCIRCNGLLETVSKDEVAGDLSEHTRETFDDFRRCTACEQVYWKGAHHERMQSLIESVLASANGTL